MHSYSTLEVPYDTSISLEPDLGTRRTHGDGWQLGEPGAA